MDLAPQRFGWLPAWFKHAVVSFGGAGLFLAAFFDSSVLSFPFLMDLLLIEICAAHKDFALYYVGMTVAGSLAGCLFLYFLAKRGGEKFYRRRTGKWSVRIRKWVEKHGFLSVFVPAVLPPPFPFEPFIIGAGVLQAPVGTFALAVLLGRGLRYSIEGYLAVRYGGFARQVVFQHKLAFALGFIIVCAGLSLGYRLMVRAPEEAA
ncbi:MAG: YqaA family protein [Candidatus Acidiferrales bacterium]